jgi:hypothetical protein
LKVLGYYRGGVLRDKAVDAEKNEAYSQEQHCHRAGYRPRLYGIGTMGDHKKHIVEGQYSGDYENNLGCEQHFIPPLV